MKIHGISDQELRALCNYIEAQGYHHDDGERSVIKFGSVIDFADHVRK
jgi:hypothetical protein